MSLTVPHVQACAFNCGLTAQASIVQVVRDAPATKKVIPYCGDHLDVFCIALVREKMKSLEETGAPHSPDFHAVLDALEKDAQRMVKVRAGKKTRGPR